MDIHKCSHFLRAIVLRAEQRLERAQRRTPLSELWHRVKDAAPVRSFSQAIASEFGLIAEIKVKSPSAGDMIKSNVTLAPKAYTDSPIVKAISVLTNVDDFGMGIDRLRRIRKQTSKPLLRKDFLFSEYHVVEARANGADAILLMANILSANELAELGDLAAHLGMEVLFESHQASEVEKIPHWAQIYGINCRKLDSSNPFHRYCGSRLLRRIGLFRDLSIQNQPLALINRLPPHAIKVAESGMTPDTIANVKKLGYNSALVGNSLLLASMGVVGMLQQFERALETRRFECDESSDSRLALRSAMLRAH